ncbi:MAG: hypothetical protein PVS2B2_04190 [Candidatus Acidiferrum sp.]
MRAKRCLIPIVLIGSFLTAAACLFAGCGTDTPKPVTKAESKPVALAIPAEIDDAAKALLGSSAQVLVFGDLAKTGKQQFLAANVVPNTPNSKVAGLVVTRAIVAENEDGKWTEVLHCDEYLKNRKGYLAMTPLSPVTGWKLQFEQSAMLGLALYFTPLQTATESHTFPIGVRWNAATKRYQSLDRNYEHFLGEAVALENVRSQLR